MPMKYTAIELRRWEYRRRQFFDNGYAVGVGWLHHFKNRGMASQHFEALRRTALDAYLSDSRVIPPGSGLEINLALG
jgi:hypothetical protein